MLETDIQELHTGFGVMQNWESMSIAKFTKYFEEQESGIRQVLVATKDAEVAGYITLIPNDSEGPFANKQIPTVKDFNVLIKFRNQGIGTKLMDEVENLAKTMSNEISLAVALYGDYGSAQRMYVKRGYIPDGSGIWHQSRNLNPYESCFNDDDLVLYMSKKF